MRHVDALSRASTMPGEELEPATIDVFQISQCESDWLIGMQQLDEELLSIIRILKRKPKTADERQTHENHELYDGRLFRLINGSRRWVVPKQIRWRVVRLMHDDIGHVGVDKTVEKINEHFWFPRIRDFVKRYISACIECCYTKSAGGQREGELHPIEKIAVPFHTVHLDHLGPFPKSKAGNNYLIVMVGGFSKYVVMKAVKNTSTPPVIQMMESWMVHFGISTRIISDRGAAFTSSKFAQFCKENAIKHILNATATPRANGQCERYNRSILSMLKAKAMNNVRTWDVKLNDLQWAINNNNHGTTKVSPQKLILTYNPRSILQNKLILALNDHDERECDIETLNEIVKNRLKIAGEKQKQRFDAAHKLPISYKEGDLVLLKWGGGPATGASRKLSVPYRGPYLVKQVLPHDRYVVTDVEGAEQGRRGYEGVHASDRMKPWCALQDLDFDDSDEDISGVRMGECSPDTTLGP